MGTGVRPTCLAGGAGITPLVSRVDPAGARPAARYAAPQQVESQMSEVAAPHKDEAQGAQLRALIQGTGEVPRAEGQQRSLRRYRPAPKLPPA